MGEVVDSEPDENISSLPDYDLPTKRDKTKLESYSAEEKTPRLKVDKEKEMEPADWDRLNQRKETTPDQQPSLIMGQGQKPESSPDDDLKLKVSQKKPVSIEPEALMLKPFVKTADDYPAASQT